MTTKVIASHSMSSNNIYGLRNYRQLWTLSQFSEPHTSSKLSSLYKPVVCFRVFILISGYFIKVLLKLFNGHISEFTVKQDKVSKDLK